MNALPTGGRVVAPESLVGLFVIVDRINSCILSLLFLSLAVITQFCKKNHLIWDT